MRVIVILSLFAAVAAKSLDAGCGAVTSFEDHPRISVNKQLRNEASTRIANGNEAAPKQFPYQAGLYLYKKKNAFWCGGSIISNRWVLTAAHCTVSVTQDTEVYLGAWKRSNISEEHQVIIYVPPINIIVHEMFNSTTFMNDISLIMLPNVIEFNEYIQPVNLPLESKIYSTYVHEMAITSGWGDFSKKEKHDPDILRWIKTPVLSNNKCASHYFQGMVTSANICTENRNGTGACLGDSGGPLVLADGSRTLIGISSYTGRDGCDSGVPSVFIRTTSYLDWIRRKTVLGKN